MTSPAVRRRGPHRDPGRPRRTGPAARRGRALPAGPGDGPVTATRTPHDAVATAGGAVAHPAGRLTGPETPGPAAFGPAALESVALGAAGPGPAALGPAAPGAAHEHAADRPRPAPATSGFVAPGAVAPAVTASRLLAPATTAPATTAPVTTAPAALSAAALPPHLAVSVFAACALARERTPDRHRAAGARPAGTPAGQARAGCGRGPRFHRGRGAGPVPAGRSVAGTGARAPVAAEVLPAWDHHRSDLGMKVRVCNSMGCCSSR